MKGIVALESAHDLCRKLQRDFERVVADPLNVDAAFDFFVTAYHLLQCRWRGEANREERLKVEKTVMMQVLSAR